MSDFQEGDIIRVVRDTQGVEASSHLMQVISATDHTIYAGYLSSNDLTYGQYTMNNRHTREGLSLDANCVEKL